jgi:WD40 repeat protein
MNRRVRVLPLFVLIIAAVAHGQKASLTPVKSIGVGRDTDKWGWMSYVAFSPDGKQIASDGPTDPQDVSGNLSIWSFPEGQLIRKIAGGPATLSEDWQYSIGSDGLSDVLTGKPPISLGDDKSAIFAISPASRLLAESSDKYPQASRIRVLTLPDMKRVSAFGKYSPQTFAISPDETTLAAGYWDEVILWDISNGKKVAALRGFGRYVRSLSFSKDGTYLGAGTDTGDVEVWDVQSRSRVSAAHLGWQMASQPAFSPNGKMVAVGLYGSGTVFLLDLHSGKVLDQKKVSDLGCGSVAFSPDGKFLITPSTGGIVKWPYDRGGTVRVFRVNSR